MVHRLIALLIALGWPMGATGAPCAAPGISQGWAQTFYGTTVVTGFLYDQSAQVLYVSMVGGSFNDFVAVPYGTAQQFTTTAQPDAFFQNIIMPSYEQVLLTQKCGLLQTEAGGYILTD